MNELTLRLLPEDGRDPQELVLLPHRPESSILDTVSASSSYVFCDSCYQAQLIGISQGITNFSMLLNGSEVDISFSPDSGMIIFQDRSFGAQIFRECYAFAQLTLLFVDMQGVSVVLETELVQVMVRKGPKNDAVSRMTEYVYSKNSSLLAGPNTFAKSIDGLKESEKKTIESRILLLEQISIVYEENYRYFKANSRFSVIPRERVDHFEKLQFISRNTIQYITQHPEELQAIHDPKGIRVGKTFYQPNKTLITDNSKSYDIYENRVIVGFLRHLLYEVERIHQDLTNVLAKIPQKPLETDEYITSSFFIYANTIKTIKDLLKKVSWLQQRYAQIYNSYTIILPVKEETVSRMPKLTPVFRSVPQYHQIYDCALLWFSTGVFTIQEEQFMLSVIRISTLYEFYVLTKLINYFQHAGYSPKASEKVAYASPGKYFENTSCNNRFVFSNQTSTVTVFYQPVIYNTDHETSTGIGLYRNTSIPFPKNDDALSFAGKYYTPDFLIKYEYANSNLVKYLIVDAKYSTLQTVKQKEVASLAYKYLFSIAPVSHDSQIVALCIFNGQSDPLLSDSFTNVYDYELSDPIMPRACIVTLTENSIDNSALHDTLLHNSIGLYTTEAPQKLVPLPVSTSIAKLTQEPIQIQPEPDAASDNGKRSNGSNKLKKSTNKSEAITSVLELSIKELKLDKEIEDRLLVAGFTCIRDLVPNLLKKDLRENTILNRRARREAEARLKQKRIVLR